MPHNTVVVRLKDGEFYDQTLYPNTTTHEFMSACDATGDDQVWFQGLSGEWSIVTDSSWDRFATLVRAHDESSGDMLKAIVLRREEWENEDFEATIEQFNREFSAIV